MSDIEFLITCNCEFPVKFDDLIVSLVHNYDDTQIAFP